jgi:predicted ArsR family transcriptional regulator
MGNVLGVHGGKQNKQRILLLLQANPLKEMNVAEISQTLGLNQTSVRTALHELTRKHQNLVFLAITKKQHCWYWRN